MTNLQPFGNRIVVEISDLEENLGGIIVTTAKENSNKGIVVAVGDGEDAKKIKIGEKLIFPVNLGLSYSDDSGNYRVLEAKDIIGKIIGE